MDTTKSNLNLPLSPNQPIIIKIPKSNSNPADSVSANDDGGGGGGFDYREVSKHDDFVSKEAT
ncbi:FRAS1-related extracellular matrix protein 2 [Corchorus capsularis]|uniref:FRAS1-related extracellular matrix protein 2 n=1 Tax=Corchorus capsularis TaxID=210143 RepID=A0A1R3IUB1_COCAP|nr:FRAS1-related extracellular matrix protein 2 [Corchorus capsularis]